MGHIDVEEVRANFVELADEYVQTAYDVQAWARQHLVSAHVAIRQGDDVVSGEVTEVHLDAENGLLFRVALHGKDGKLVPLEQLLNRNEVGFTADVVHDTLDPFIAMGVLATRAKGIQSEDDV